jgi:hypothetical protein
VEISISAGGFPMEVWLSQAAAAKRLDVTPRRIRQLVQDRKLEARRVRLEGRPDELQIERASLDSYAARKRVERQTGSLIRARQIVARQLEAAPAPALLEAPPAPPRAEWLTVPQAAARTGLPLNAIERAILEGRLPVLPYREPHARVDSYRIHAADLEALRGRTLQTDTSPPWSTAAGA